MSGSLLPRSHQEFGSAEYWEKFFTHRGAKTFEWYGEYPELCGILHKYVKPADSVLVVGCGNSELSAQLYDVGYHAITNVDISEVVIRQMQDKHGKQRPKMKYLKKDMTKTDFNDGIFSTVLDKGTLDAIMTDTSEKVVNSVDMMFAEIDRILKVGGRYICISLAQNHILHKVIHWFYERGWMVRVCRVQDVYKQDQEFHMPVFAFVMFKLKKMPNVKPVLELSVFEDKSERYDDCDKLFDAVTAVQRYGILRQQLNKRSVAGEDISMDLLSPESQYPRYTVHIVDSLRKRHKEFGVFIIPQGRECEWLFSTHEGRRELSDQAEFQRLAVISLHRAHQYGTMDDIRLDLASKIIELAPSNLRERNIPFMTVGEDLDQRQVRERGHSEYSGEYFVEDGEADGATYRRLIFLSNENIVQSSARLHADRSKKKHGKRKSTLKPDLNYLCHSYQNCMINSFAFLGDFKQLQEQGFSVLLVGLGGGSLPMYIHTHFSKVRVSVVELDPCVVQVAKKWFGFIEDDRMIVTVADGLRYIQESEEKYDVLILDVDSKDTSTGMGCPPQTFLEPQFLARVNTLLNQSGILILNLMCRNPDLKAESLRAVKSVFPTVLSSKIEDDLNEVLVALPQEMTGVGDFSVDTLRDQAIQNMQNMGAASNSQDITSASDAISRMNIV